MGPRSLLNISSGVTGYSKGLLKAQESKLGRVIRELFVIIKVSILFFVMLTKPILWGRLAVTVINDGAAVENQ